MLRIVRSITRTMTTEAVHTEGRAKIYAPQAAIAANAKAKAENKTKSEPKQAFLNPVQEYNRDLSIVAIRTWSELFDAEKKVIWSAAEARRAAKLARKSNSGTTGAAGERPGKRRKGENGQPVDVQPNLEPNATGELVRLLKP